MTEQQPVTILLVEDDPGHSRLIEKSLRRANIQNDIIKLTDGQQAVDFLFSPNGYVETNSPSPLVILLDLNMPILDGTQVLQRIKADRRTKHIPVLILTSSGQEEEISRCYELGCNGFLTKPVDPARFSEAVHKLGLFLLLMRVT